jgi:uncharacterized tellurite resistance protein B-like protein
MIILEQLKMLVNLAMIDGSMAEKEKTFIKKIGVAHGFPESSVETLFYNQHELIMPDKLTADQKFNFALSLFQLMKLDEKLYQPEIKFCGSMMEKLGYKKEVVGEFMLSAKSEVMTADEIDSLKRKTASYLITN